MPTRFVAIGSLSNTPNADQIHLTHFIMFTLYTYFQSSAAYRVRIALNLKHLNYSAVPIHLLRGGGEQHQPEYQAINPFELVPSLRHDALVLTQSMAILEYIEELYPSQRLLPVDRVGRAAFARSRSPSLVTFTRSIIYACCSILRMIWELVRSFVKFTMHNFCAVRSMSIQNWLVPTKTVSHSTRFNSRRPESRGTQRRQVRNVWNVVFTNGFSEESLSCTEPLPFNSALNGGF